MFVLMLIRIFMVVVVFLASFLPFFLSVLLVVLMVVVVVLWWFVGGLGLCCRRFAGGLLAVCLRLQTVPKNIRCNIHHRCVLDCIRNSSS